mmetsp:Transcript_1703/g.4192  ORF Transcript_1703/g.4192 Transcript_1703/m.4192 type:complete len:117 (-) Transcript_1703:1130-1480(-)|eukprot:CAMPEP_0119548312 /NCGR_PEP_ID=MMETSP1352-20130426/2260_1 /TAXON_ID=265584 /ORGANISM="Stauroneis constricta, Strain CCMP1120" /LENGTH=116 /DNA_ID=CAMNT_0007593541 /DNA_START=118 /DNA_END=468 /DNA_ORIENTATION=-
MGKTEFSGGSLSFKGDSKKKKKRSKRSQRRKHDIKKQSKKEEDANKILKDEAEEDFEDELTDAERKAIEKRKARQTEDNKKIASQSHRDRIEQLNEKLSTMTELNDIPRVSAAGNG